MPWNISLPPAQWFDRTTPGFDGLVREVTDAPVVAIDTETTGLDIINCQAIFWSLSWGENRICLPVDTLPCFKKAFQDPNKTWLLANAKFDTHMLANIGTTIAGRLADTQVMHAMLYEEMSHRLKDMMQQMFGWKWNDFKTTFGTIKKGEQTAGDLLMAMYHRDRDLLVDYASDDAYGTYKLYMQLKQELDEAKIMSLYPDQYDSLWDLFDKVEVPFTKVLWKCERRGIMIDTGYLNGIAGPIEEQIKAMEREAVHIVGRPINLQSTPQLSAYFIDECKLKPLKLTKGGKSGVRKPSIDEDFLDYYKNENPLAKLMLEHRSISKMLSTTVRGLITVKDRRDRVHTTFNQDIARTGRLSSKQPNLQNVPNPDKDKFWVRDAFTCETHKLLVVADYEQLEMRLLAAAAGQESMIQIFLDGKDIHMGNAEQVYGIPYDDLKTAKKYDKEIKDAKRPESEYLVTLPGGRTVKACLEARNNIKAVGFGLNYGMKEGKLGRDLGIPKEEAKKIIDEYMRRLPAVAAFYEAAINDAREKGYAFSLMGRRRFLPDIASASSLVRWTAERQAVNMEIQGTAADAAKMAMIHIENDDRLRELGYEMLLQVHDEIVGECPAEAAEEVKKRKKELMEHPFPTDLKVPLDASIGVGFTWRQAK